MVGALIATHFLEDGYDSASSRSYLAIKTPEPPWNIPMLSVLLACFLWTTFFKSNWGATSNRTKGNHIVLFFIILK